jgi:hypothetical protein
MTKKTANEVTLNTLEAKGEALLNEWKSIDRGLKASFTKHTKADGFDTRLGQLMLALKAEGGERISSQRLKDCHINGIDKRRRSEALWFVENEKEARAFMKASKKGFTSLSALQKAMAKASKPKADKADAKSTEGDVKSDVGPKQPKAEAVKPTKLDADTLAEQVFDLLEANGIPLKEFEASFMAIKSILQDEDTNKKAVA